MLDLRGRRAALNRRAAHAARVGGFAVLAALAIAATAPRLAALNPQQQQQQQQATQARKDPDKIGAPEAERYGFIERVVPKAELRDAALTRCVKTLAAEHAWFVLVDNGKAWLFSDEAQSFADGEEFGMFSDYV